MSIHRFYLNKEELLILNRNLFIVVIPLVILLSSCSSGSSSNEAIQGEAFSSKKKALDNFVTEENIKGNMVLVQTHKDEQILVAEYNKDEYTLGELIVKDNEYKVIKITGVHSLRGLIGTGWEFTTTANNEYSINFLNEKHHNSVHFPERKFYFEIGKGHTLSKTPSIISDAIVSTETIN